MALESQKGQLTFHLQNRNHMAGKALLPYTTQHLHLLVELSTQFMPADPPDTHPDPPRPHLCVPKKHVEYLHPKCTLCPKPAAAAANRPHAPGAGLMSTKCTSNALRRIKLPANELSWGGGGKEGVVCVWFCQGW